MIQEELLRLYMELLKKAVQDQYRGHEDYDVMLGKIDEKIPIVGGNINVQKQDPRTGQFYTVTYHVAVFDDLGYPIHGIRDIGGQCVKGEVAHRDHIFTCMKCRKLVCDWHVGFVDDDIEKPLCKGIKVFDCYNVYYRHYEDKARQFRKAAEDLAAEAQYETAKRLLKRIKKGELVPSDDSFSQLGYTPRVLPAKRTKSGIVSIQCPNSDCKKDIKLKGVLCLNCRGTFSVYEGEHLSCPHCGSGIIQCPHCEGEIEF